MKRTNILALLVVLFLAPFVAFARAFAPQGVDAFNTAGSRDGALTRTAEAAITFEHQMVTAGTAKAKQVIVCTATTYPLGHAYDPAIIGAAVGVVRLMDGGTKLGVASKAIAADVAVFTTAGGKLTDTAVNNCFRVGRSLTAAAVDTDEFEYLPCSPVLTTV